MSSRHSNRTINNATKVIYINMQSLGNKVNTLDLFNNVNKPDILCLAEHWLKEPAVKATYLLGYNLVTNVSRERRQHGGIAIFVSDKFRIDCKPDYHINSMTIEMNFEVAAVSLGDRACVVCVYKTQTADWEVFFGLLEQLMQYLSDRYLAAVICGDFNIDQRRTPKEFVRLSDLTASYSLSSLVTAPTRVAQYDGRMTSSSLDYLLTNLTSDEIQEVSLYDPGISDHHAIMITFELRNRSSEIKTVGDRPMLSRRPVGSRSIEDFKRLFFSFGHAEGLVMSRGGVEELFEGFLRAFKDAFDRCFPLVQRRRVTRRHGNLDDIRFSTGLTNKLEDLKFLSHLCKRVGDQDLTNSLKAFKQMVSREVEYEKRAFIERILDTSDNKRKAVWNTFHAITGKAASKRRIETITCDSRAIVDSREMAEVFACHFSNQYLDTTETMCSTQSRCTTSGELDRSIFFFPISESEVINAIFKIKNKRSTGLDGIPIRLVRAIGADIAPLLTALYNRSVAEGILPGSLKISKVIPIHKRGEASDVANYRQIAISGVFAKVFETVVSDRLVDFLTKYRVLNEFQYGFRKGLSTESATAALVQYVMDKLECGLVLVFMFDLSHAFDTLEPRFLKVKLHALGIRGPINDWLVSYLTRRTIVVEIEGNYSSPHNISVGTPQGGVLGPLLFTIFVNDMPNHVTAGKLFAYADDTALVVTGSTREELETNSEQVLSQFDEWCRVNKLTINYSKTKCVEFRLRVEQGADPCRFPFGGEIIETVQQVKYLGTWIDSQLNWSKDIDETVKKLNSAFYVIRNLKRYLNPRSLITVYYGIVQSHLTYNVLLWGRASDLDRVFVAQKRIIRLMFGLDFRESCQGTFREKQIMTVVCLYIYKALARMHVRREMLPRHAHSYETRGKNDIRLPFHKRTAYEKSPDYAGGALYNKLPESFKHMTFKKFKLELRKMLVDNAFYSLDEFITYIEDKD